MSHHSVFKKNLWSLKCLSTFLFPEQRNSSATCYKESWEKFFMDCSEALAVIKLRNFLTREHSRMNRKTRQGTATRSITLFTSIHVSLPLTWLVIISSTSWSSCVGIPMHTRCCSEVRQNVVLCCCSSAHGRYRKPGPKGWLSWTQVVLCGCVTVISTKVTNFKVENSKLKKKCCKEGFFTFSFVPFPAASTVFLLHLCMLQASIWCWEGLF